MKEIRKAVALVLIYQNEFFIIQRQNFLRTFPGYWSFPGGKVDRGDIVESLDETLLNCLKRETKEELDIELDLSKSENYLKLAKATSPAFNPYRFETYFYAYFCKEKPKMNIDRNEAKLGHWFSTNDFIDDYDRGNKLIVRPILETIKHMHAGNLSFIDFDQIRSQDEIPFIEPLSGFYQYMPLSNTVPPATRTNAFVIGDDKKVIIDPSPKDENEFLDFLKICKTLNLEKVIISHHHGDHHQFAPDLARELNLPIYLSKDTFARISKKWGDDYFKNIEVKILKEGDIIGLWKNEKIKVYEIPGHDEGHLGFAPESLKWFIVGDLFQGIGTVVVGGDEGDMTKYLASLDKVIKLAPKCVLPSHGIALGGTNILQKTKEHRLMREDQIRELHYKGKSAQDILKVIYFDLPEKLHKYALANIDSHLKRIKNQVP